MHYQLNIEQNSQSHISGIFYGVGDLPINDISRA